MDFIKFQFRDSTGLVSWPQWGTDIIFTARETTLAQVHVEPYFNEILTTEGGFTGSIRRKAPREFQLTFQLLEARTLDKVYDLYSAIFNRYRATCTIMNGNMIANPTLNTLANNVIGMACTVDLGNFEPQSIHQAKGILWKKGIPCIIRESVTLVRPTNNDIIVVGGSGGGGN